MIFSPANSCSNLKRKSQNRNELSRGGFTLVEVLLSLALTAVVAGIIGGLVQVYLTNQNLGRDRVKQTQLARALLNMIADDIRTVVRNQPFDTAGLSELLSGGQQSGGGAAAGGTGASGGAGASTGAATGGTGGMSATGGNATAGAGAASTGSSEATTPTVAALPPGIYGTSTSIDIDISRLPRPDEYVPMEQDVVNGTVADMPSDIKTVSYFVQSKRTDGVRDPLATEVDIRSKSLSADGAAGGLVRRSLDRAITLFAYEQGTTDSLQRTGELLAPEVIAIEFEYFDGQLWQSEWDSSVQGLPLVVRITLAMQLESKRQTDPVDPGQSISSLTSGSLAESGIEIYTTTTLIPGSQLLTKPQTDASAGDNGMGSLGL
ncbi:MAG: prepilin-type N-terminal cleavage/methylation domain-containing protein [Pirellula sp.]|jgi:prepilin-type N-terminal cleavage/methylation domain-containing protein